jgi:hypothetical protein
MLQMKHHQGYPEGIAAVCILFSMGYGVDEGHIELDLVVTGHGRAGTYYNSYD